jgi:hypothetical protein
VPTVCYAGYKSNGVPVFKCFVLFNMVDIAHVFGAINDIKQFSKVFWAFLSLNLPLDNFSLNDGLGTILP